MVLRFTKKLLKIIWSLFATGVVLFAVLVSLIKISLPHIQDYRTDLEELLFSNYNAKVKIGEIGASWKQSGPAVVILDAKLEPSVSAPLEFSVKEIHVEMDFWQSIMQQRFVSDSFLLNGAEVTLDSKVFWQTSPGSQGSQLFDTLSHLFLSQLQQFKIIDSRVKVRHKSGLAQEYQIDELSWLNAGLRHQGRGNVFVDGFSSNSVSLILDLYGQRRDSIFGQVYFEANQIDISPWVDPFISDHVSLQSSHANFKAWANVEQGIVNDFVIDVSDTGIRWESGRETKFLSVQDSRLQWWQSEESWILFSEDMKLASSTETFPGFKFSFFANDQQKQVEFSGAELSSLSELFSLFSATKEQHSLANSQLGGKLDSLIVNWLDNGDVFGLANIDKFSLLPQQKPEQATFGFNDLDLDVYWQNDDVLINLTGANGRFETGEVFTQPFTYSNLDVTTLISNTDNGLEVLLPKLSLDNSDLQINLSGQFTQFDQPYLSLYGEIKGPGQGTITQYLPRYVLPENTYNYLNKSIQQGRANLTQIVVEGDPTQIPFAKSTGANELGRFIIRSKFEDSIFKFSETWPAIENMNAYYIVDNTTMTIDAHSGEFAGLTINNNVSAFIDLDQPSSVVSVYIQPEQLPFSDFHNLVTNTPLIEPLGDIFEFVLLDGYGDFDVSIDIPLDDNPVNVTGSVITENSILNLPEINLEFTEMKSVVKFENSRFSIDAQSAKLFELPVSFTVNGGPQGDNYNIESQLDAVWQSDELFALYPSKLADYFDGYVTNRVITNVQIDDQGYRYFVDGNGDLTHLSYDISKPLIKSVGEYDLFSFDMWGDENGSEIHGRVEGQAYFRGELQSGVSGIARANLTLGQGDTKLPEQGFDVSLHIDQTEFEPTLQFVLDIIDTVDQVEPTGEAPILAAPHRIDGQIQQLDILGLTWDNVSLDAKPQSDGWLFSIGAKQTLTDVIVYDDTSKPIEISSSFLDIETPSFLSEKQGLEPIEEQAVVLQNSDKLIRSLPDFLVDCENCTFNENPLGRIQLKTRIDGPELIVEQFDMDYKRNKARLTGRWTGDSGPGRTLLTGKLESRYFGSWLSEFGLNTGIEDSDAYMDLNLSWRTAPYLFSMKELDGVVNFRLGDGYFSEISDQGARIFSLFSFDSLYRKLKFDFSDVFEKGLFYNDIKGDVAIKNGVAHTENVFMDGVAGDMELVGQTDLVNDTLSYDVSFKPNVMSSLPVLTAVTAGLAYTNPVTWIALFAFDKALDEVELVSEIKLSITGDIDDPQVKEVERFTKRVTLTEEEKQRLRELENQAKQKKTQE